MERISQSVVRLPERAVRGILRITNFDVLNRLPDYIVAEKSLADLVFGSAAYDGVNRLLSTPSVVTGAYDVATLAITVWGYRLMSRSIRAHVDQSDILPIWSRLGLG